jgi:hypothetical protein
MNLFKYRKSLVAIFTIMLSIFLLGCENNFNKLNTPENKITTGNIGKSELGQLFADAEYKAFIGGHDGWELLHELHASIWSQIFTTTSAGFDTDQYKEVLSWVKIGWNEFYSNPPVSLHFVRKYTAEHNMPVEHAVATIYAIPMYERMTDFFGPIPFSKFGNGKTSVPFDSQKSIYHQFFGMLDKAVATLKKHKDDSPFGNNDIVYGGDVNKWITFANSLRLKLAIRIVYAEPDTAKMEAEKAVQAGVMQNNSDNALISTTINNVNYLTTWTYIDPFAMSATQESILKGFNDPRMKVFWNSGGGRLGGNAGYHGLRNGLTSQMKQGNTDEKGASFVGPEFFPIADGGTNPPCVVMTAAQVDFLRAEGALRGWDMGGTAQHFYNEGIRASLKYWADASDAEINNYINSTNTPSAVNSSKAIIGVDFHTPPESDITVKYENSASFETQLEQIITQKWIDEFLNPWDAWAERRRTGYPRGYAIINSLNPNIPTTAIMRRIRYPSSVYSNNKDAVTEAVNKYLNGKDLNMTRLWWDKKPLGKYPDLSNTVVHLH